LSGIAPLLYAHPGMKHAYRSPICDRRLEVDGKIKSAMESEAVASRGGDGSFGKFCQALLFQLTARVYHALKEVLNVLDSIIQEIGSMYCAHHLDIDNAIGKPKRKMCSLESRPDPITHADSEFYC
jgi:hypothetical protein